MAFSKLASIGATRSTLDEFGLRAKYDLGQNFLIDDSVVGSILELAQLEPDEAVLEVGPGIGTLTSALLPHVGALVAIEADRDMRLPLQAACADYSERFALVEGDALRTSPRAVEAALNDLRRTGAVPGGLPAMPSKLVSNLPYQVAAKLILQWMQDWTFLKSMTVMVQAEVADRISADPGSKVFGAYTLKLQLLARLTGRFEVSRTCFFPAPHVESAVIRLDRIQGEDELDPTFARECSQVIDAAFSMRRKTIRNAMAKQGYDRARLDAAYDEAGIDGSVRAEMLSREDFIRLTRALIAR